MKAVIASIIARPIGVLIISFLLLLGGGVAAFRLPLSLLPNIEIPRIILLCSQANTSVEDMETGLIRPLRREMLQLNDLQDLTSRAIDGGGIIKLEFEYGKSMERAFMDVSERVDAAMSYLPTGTKRPVIIKARATDLPVFNLRVSLSGGENRIENDDLLSLSDVASSVIKKALEQSSNIAFVDLTGSLYPQWTLIPDKWKMESRGLEIEDLRLALQRRQLRFNDLTLVQDNRRVHLYLGEKLGDIADIEDIFIRKNGKVFQIKEIARVERGRVPPKGAFLADGKQGLSLSIIKRPEARMDELQEDIEQLLKNWEYKYPELEFSITQDQGSLLRISLASLYQSLWVGGSLAFMVIFFFFKNKKLPWLIGLSIPFCLLLSLWGFYGLGLSINIISLSGLLLGIGLMIDNAIIVLDNISHYFDNGEELFQSCLRGSTEVMAPLLSSALTTCSVFLPLTLFPGIAGALFYDQALAVAIGLGASLLVSLCFLPTLFNLIHKSGKGHPALNNRMILLENIYKNTLEGCMKRQKTFLISLVIVSCTGVLLFLTLPKSRFPQLTRQGMILKVKGKSDAPLDETLKLTRDILASTDSFSLHSDAFVGTQDLVITDELPQEVSDLSISFQCEDENQLLALQERLTFFFERNSSGLSYSFHPAKNMFERLLGHSRPPLQLKLRSGNSGIGIDPKDVNSLRTFLWEKHALEIKLPPTRLHKIVIPKFDKLKTYKIGLHELFESLRVVFRGLPLVSIQEGNREVRVVFEEKLASAGEDFARVLVKNQEGRPYPVSAMVEVKNDYSFSLIHADRWGPFLPIDLSLRPAEVRRLESSLTEFLLLHPEIQISLHADQTETRNEIRKMSGLLALASFVLFAILTAQFESLLYPLIILAELPISLSAALIALYLGGSTINLMAMIGMVVMSGIVINDSILKIDTIKRFIDEEVPLQKAISKAGKRRLRAILMTSMTTMLAVMPILLGKGLGAELQRPLALALLGGMSLGTLVSLFFIPLAFKYLFLLKES